MVKITCTICDKPFRSESGLAWHVEHAHVDSEDHGSEEPIDSHQNVRPGIPEQDELVIRLTALEERVAGQSDQDTQNVDRLRAELEPPDHSEALSRLQETTERLEARLASVESKVQRLEDLPGKITTLTIELGDLRYLVLSAAQLVGNLDLDHRMPKLSFSRLGDSLNSSPGELEQARGRLRRAIRGEAALPGTLDQAAD